MRVVRSVSATQAQIVHTGLKASEVAQAPHYLRSARKTHEMKKGNYECVLLLGAAALSLFGCSHGDAPNYQGRRAPAPTTEDYLPSPTNKASTNAQTPGDVLMSVEKHLQELAAAIESKDARAVHEHDTAVRQLIGKIPERAAPDIKAHVDEHVREISDAAKAAHAAAHDENWAKAESDVKRAQESLKHLRANFKEVPH